MSYSSSGFEPEAIKYPKDGSVPKDNKSALQYAIDCKNYGLKFRQQYEPEWRDAYQAYKQILPDEEVTLGRAQLFVPYVFSIIESMLPEMLLTLFNEKEIVKFVSVDPRRTDAAELASKMFHLFLNRISIFCKMEEALRTALLYGDCAAKVPFIRRLNSNGRIERLPGFSPMDPWHFVKDPKTPDLQAGHFCGHMVKKTLKELRSMEKLGNYKNVNSLVEHPPLDSNSEPGASDRLSIASKSFPDGNPQDAWEVWEMWIDDRLIVFGEDRVLLRNTQNPFVHQKKPFVNFSAYPDSGNAYNMGVPKILEHLQREANSYRNARLDNVLMSMMGMLKMERSARINPSDLILRPGGIIRTDDNEGLEKMEMGGVPHTAFMEQEAFDRDIQRTSGVYEHFQGASPRREETATGIISLQQAAGRRLMLMIKRIGEGPLPQFAEMATSLIQQFAEDEIVIPFMDEDQMVAYDYFNKEDIQGDFMFEFSSRPEDLSVDAQRNNAVAKWNMFGQVPFANPIKLMADVLKAFGNANVREYINPQYHQLLGVQQRMLQDPANPLAQQMAMSLGPNGMGMAGGAPQLQAGPPQQGGGGNVPGPGGMPGGVPPEIMQMIMQLLASGGMQQ